MSKIILAGATGLVGGHVARLLADTEHALHTVSRRPIADLPDAVIQHITPTEEWPEILDQAKADIAISCLGTTIKKAGSQDAFRAVDLELISTFAAAARKGGARHFISISSTMANSKASNFYLKTKGEAEDALHSLGFDRLDLIRPGLLKGDRAEFRLGEQIGVMVSPLVDLLLHGSMRRYRSISAETVAHAVVNLIGADGQGASIHENDAITALAAKKRG